MIDKYKEAFQEEAREILLELEAALLELNERSNDAELVGRIFRALHTIKGSGAMFGFQEISSFTHHVENAFDQVRNGVLTVTPDLVNISLAAADQIKAMLDEISGGAPADATTAVMILDKVRQLMGAVGEKTEAKKTAAAAPAAEAAKADPPTEATRDWHIVFPPGPDLARSGTNPLLLIRELRELGKLQVTANVSAIPVLEELDPERCYVAWDM